MRNDSIILTLALMFFIFSTGVAWSHIFLFCS
jgi:hypothetical protein